MSGRAGVSLLALGLFFVRSTFSQGEYQMVRLFEPFQLFRQGPSGHPLHLPQLVLVPPANIVNNAMRFVES